jgi:hypothetical protein
LTGVDLVCAGANQEADICLFKSADAPCESKLPTEPETNILKRFLHWMREERPADESSPLDAVEKGHETFACVRNKQEAEKESRRCDYELRAMLARCRELDELLPKLMRTIQMGNYWTIGL